MDFSTIFKFILENQGNGPLLNFNSENKNLALVKVMFFHKPKYGIHKNKEI